jgi:ATP-dependent RNA helicase DeaD
MENILFKDLKLSKEVQKAIEEMGFEEATYIQGKAIPEILEGKDIVGLSQTGTGKTCAFGIPAIEGIDIKVGKPQILIVTPTRELSVQIAAEITKLTRFKRGIRSVPVYGGQNIERQIMAMKKKPVIIIGTPGRLIDHINRGTLKLDAIKMVVLDEADEMLNMGFRDDINEILKSVPEERQTLLFSATMPKDIMEITKKYQKKPVTIRSQHKQLTVPSIEQYYVEISQHLKTDLVSKIVDENDAKLTLVFCNTKKTVDELTGDLKARGYQVEGLHGDMKQLQRDRVMGKFRKTGIEILIATDVAARGIDVENVDLVINYDVPNDEEYYVHRIGRTGRAGRAGVAYTIASGRDIYKLRDIQKYTKTKILEYKKPSLFDLEENKVSKVMEKLSSTLEDDYYKKYVRYIENLLDNDEVIQRKKDEYITSIDICAAFLQMACGDERPIKKKVLKINKFNRVMMVRYFISVGMNACDDPETLFEEIVKKSKIDQRNFGDIEMFDKFSFISVLKEKEDVFKQNTKNMKINGKRVSIQQAVNKNKKTNARS